MTTTFLLAALLSVVPHDAAVVDRCDLVELNRFHDEEGHEVFTQLIYFDWHERQGCFHVVDWKLVRCHSSLSFVATIPVYDYERREYRSLVCCDGEQLIEVTAPHYRETFTQYDPEVLDRDQWPAAKRRRLLRP
jgi:hypothetical protein